MAITQCILTERNKNGCENCNSMCAHRIALNGLNGKGGRIASANVPGEYRHLTLATAPARETQSEIFEKVLTPYVATFQRMFDANGMRIKSQYLFSDNTGTGKSSSASAILNEYIIANYLGSLKRGIQPLQQPAYFLDVNEWQTLYNGFSRQGIPQDIAEKHSKPYYAMLERAKYAPFAVLDDIGVRSASEAFRGDLHDVINYRAANGLPTVYTSNIPMKELATVFDKRLYDRVRDQCAELAFVGESKRGRR